MENNSHLMLAKSSQTSQEYEQDNDMSITFMISHKKNHLFKTF